MKIQDMKMTDQVARHENDGPSKSQGVKMQDMKIQDLKMQDLILEGVKQYTSSAFASLQCYNLV